MTGIRSISFANALALVSVGAYFLCLVLAAAAPDLFAAIVESWFHGTLPGLGTGARVTAGGMLLGVFTVGVSAWVFGLALAAVYNRLGGRRTGQEAGG
jgi:multisubunit Na+/H+ antiporter MnhB subunit